LTQRALDGQEHWPLSTAVDQRSEVVVTGALVDDPDGTRFTSHVLVRLDRARVEGGEWQDTGGRTVLVAAESDAGPRLALLDAGDRVRLRGYLRPLEGF